MPGDDVERREVLVRAEQLAFELLQHLEAARAILVVGCRALEVPRVCEPIGTCAQQKMLPSLGITVICLRTTIRTGVQVKDGSMACVVCFQW